MNRDAVVRRVEQHLAAVGAVDIAGLRDLYAPDARLFDPVGGSAVVGRQAIAAHFTRWLTAARLITDARITVMGADNCLAVVAFTATPDGGDPVDVVDVMRFGDDLLIREMAAFSTPGPIS